MITDGSYQPEEFTSSDGEHYTGDAVDTSTLVYSSTSETYTRTYVNGTVITFNSTGQETSVADRNGNTYSFAYLTSGPARGRSTPSPARTGRSPRCHSTRMAI